MSRRTGPQRLAPLADRARRVERVDLVALQDRGRARVAHPGPVRRVLTAPRSCPGRGRGTRTRRFHRGAGQRRKPVPRRDLPALPSPAVSALPRVTDDRHPHPRRQITSPPSAPTPRCARTRPTSRRSSSSPSHPGERWGRYSIIGYRARERRRSTRPARDALAEIAGDIAGPRRRPSRSAARPSPTRRRSRPASPARWSATSPTTRCTRRTTSSPGPARTPWRG